MAFETKEEYYSGQGVVMVARRDSVTGKPLGFRPVGNCPELKISFDVTTLEHKESTTGARATDLRLITENKCNLDFTLENFLSKNLADAIRGSYTEKAAATVTGEAVKGYPGLVTSLANISVSAAAIKQASTSLTAYVNDSTAWDYRLNAEAGSFKLNDGALVGFAAVGEVITAITVGATTSLAIASSALVVGQYVFVGGLTGVDAALVNGKRAKVLTNTGTAVTIDIVTTGKTITATGTPRAVGEGVALTADYTYAAQYQVEALTEGGVELALRFEGLNTANGNAPVIVEVFRFLVDPTQELSLIGDGVQSFAQAGSVLADTTRVTGSKFLNVRKLT